MNNLFYFYSQYSKKTKPVFWLLALISFFISYSSLASAENNPENFFEKALISFQNKQYSTSIIHLKNHLKQTPEHLSSRVLLAENYLALSQGLNAETELNIADKLSPNNAKISLLLARAYLLQKKYDQVLEILIPRHHDIHFQSAILAYRGLAYLGNKQYLLSEKELEKSLNIVPINIDAILGMAKLALANKNNTKAIQYIEKASSIAPENKHALLMAAITYKLLQDTKQALAAANKLLQLEPNNYSALLIRANLYADLKQHESSLKDIEKITQEMPNEPISNYVKFLSLNAINEDSSADETLAHLEAIMGIIPKEIMDEEPIYYFLAGLINFQSGAFESAEKSLLKYYNFYPEDLSAIKLLARAQMASGQYAQARKYLIKGHLLNQKELEILSLLGKVSMLLGQLSKAEYYFKLVNKYQPNSLTAKEDLARLYMVSGKQEKLINLFPDAINNKNTSQQLSNETLFMLASAYQESNDLTSALIITEQIIKQEPNNSYAFQLRGSLLGLMGNIAQAQQDYIKAVKLDANNFQVVMHLSRLELAQGKAEQAISRLKKQLEKGNNSALFIELGDSYSKIGDTKNADIYYRKALTHNPSSILSLTKVVEKHVANNEITEAINTVEEYLKKYDGNPEAHHLAADLYFKNNQYNEALAELESAVKASNVKGPNLLKLAKMQLRLTQRDNAINSLNRAIGWENEYLPAYLLLVAIYTEDKNQEEAHKIIKRMASFNHDEFLHYRLKGEIQWAIGNINKAEELFLQSIKIKPTKPAVLGLYRIYRKNKQFEKVDNLLKNWLEKNPNDLTSAISRAENYRQQGNLEQAKAYYNQLLTIGPNNILLLNNAAIIEQLLGNLDSAAKLAQRAYKLANKNVNVIDTKAWIEVQRGNFDYALSLLREANTLDYQNAEVKYHLAVTLDKLGRRNEGLAYLEAAVNSSQDFLDKDKALVLLTTWQTKTN